MNYIASMNRQVDQKMTALQQQKFSQQISDWLDSRTLSANTRRNYNDTLARLETWLISSGKTLQDMNTGDYLLFLDWLSTPTQLNGGGLSQSSIIQIRRITSNFLQWMVEQGELTKSPAWALARSYRSDQNNQLSTNRRSEQSIEEQKPNATLLAQIFNQSTDTPSQYSKGILIANLIVWGGLTLEQLSRMNLLKIIEQGQIADVHLKDTFLDVETRVTLPFHLATLLRQMHGLSPENKVPNTGLVLIPGMRGKNACPSTLYRLLRKISIKKNQPIGIRKLRMLVRSYAEQLRLPYSEIAHLQRVKQLTVRPSTPNSIEATLISMMRALRCNKYHDAHLAIE